MLYISPSLSPSPSTAAAAAAAAASSTRGSLVLEGGMLSLGLSRQSLLLWGCGSISSIHTVSAFVTSATGTGQRLEDSLHAALEDLAKRGCPPGPTVCELFVGTGFAEYELALDIVNRELKPEALVGCAVHAVRPGGSSSRSTRGVAIRARVMPPGTVVVPFSYLPKSAHRVQVGRYNAHTRPDTEERDFSKFTSLSTPSTRTPLPPALVELQNAKSLAPPLSTCVVP